MNAHNKKIFTILGWAVVLLLAAFVFVLTFDINSYKPRIEAAASEAAGLEVTIKGKIGLSLFPFGISADKLNASNNGSEIVSVENLRLGAALIPLLKKQFKASSFELIKPVLTIVKDADGKYNFESTKKRPAEAKQEGPLTLNELKILKGELLYLDKKTGEKTELKDFNLLLKGISIEDTSSDIIKQISFKGSLDSKEIQKNKLRIYNLRSDIKAEKGIIYAAPLTMDIFGSKAEGDITADSSEADAMYKINLRISKLDFAKLEESLGTEKIISGEGDLEASITIKDKQGRNMMSGMDGTVSLHGDDLVIYNMDLDKVLTKYETSQEINLVDIGAFFIAGPLGNVALKGYRYGDVYLNAQGGQGTIKKFISNWNIKGGMANAADVALATRRNRLALKGKLDLVRARYDNVTVALLDDKGCAKFRQKISGPFDSPEIGAVSAVSSLAEPVFDLFRKAKNFVQGGKCEVFYNGAVQQPAE